MKYKEKKREIIKLMGKSCRCKVQIEDEFMPITALTFPSPPFQNLPFFPFSFSFYILMKLNSFTTQFFVKRWKFVWESFQQKVEGKNIKGRKGNKDKVRGGREVRFKRNNKTTVKCIVFSSSLFWPFKSIQQTKSIVIMKISHTKQKSPINSFVQAAAAKKSYELMWKNSEPTNEVELANWREKSLPWHIATLWMIIIRFSRTFYIKMH